MNTKTVEELTALVAAQSKTIAEQEQLDAGRVKVMNFYKDRFAGKIPVETAESLLAYNPDIKPEDMPRILKVVNEYNVWRYTKGDLAPSVSLDSVPCWIETPEGLCQAQESASGIQDDTAAFVRLSAVKAILAGVALSKPADTVDTPKITAYVKIEDQDWEYNGIDEFSGGRTGGIPLVSLPDALIHTARAVAAALHDHDNDAALRHIDKKIDATIAELDSELGIAAQRASSVQPALFWYVVMPDGTHDGGVPYLSEEEAKDYVENRAIPGCAVRPLFAAHPANGAPPKS